MQFINNGMKAFTFLLNAHVPEKGKRRGKSTLPIYDSHTDRMVRQQVKVKL